MGQPFCANTFAVADLVAAWHSRVRGTGSAGECRRGLLPVIPGVCRDTLLLLGMELPVARIPSVQGSAAFAADSGFRHRQLSLDCG
ncbi:hypothetical protein D3C81_1852750 [compost metagenome]